MTRPEPALSDGLANDCALVRELRLNRFLSFGPDSPPIALGNLNVLIGPNGSGKSNLIEGIALLRACPTDVSRPVGAGGGVSEWIWKGEPTGVAHVEAVIANPKGPQSLRHVIEFGTENQAFHLVDERVENEAAAPGHAGPTFHYRQQRGRPVLRIREDQRRLQHEEVDLGRSILEQRKDPESYPEITYLGRAYDGIRIYREWAFGRKTVFRQPQPADGRQDRLEEDFSNLGLWLNRLRRGPATKRVVRSRLMDLYGEIDDFDVSVIGNTVQVLLTEGMYAIPATRLSDGTLRYLCLLAILCDPEPPSLVCLEEPEVGLHPDLIPKVADLLVEASSRTQLMVTTHSDILIDALTEQWRSLIVCEKHDGQTELRHLEEAEVAPWLDRYRLGQLWMRGDLGGNRW